MNRREFVQSTGALVMGSVGLHGCKAHEEKPIFGRIVGANATLGHRLRVRDLPEPSQERETEVVIIGAGIAGMTAARELRRAGIRDVMLLEASDRPGGNSTFGENGVSAYPWGAHYVPLARNDDSELIGLYQQLGIVLGFERDLPKYNEYFLSADPQERLLMNGHWQEGLVPVIGATADDHEQYRRFFTLIDRLKGTRGIDGKPAFCIPVDNSSSDPQWRALDLITMADYMRSQRFTSIKLNWYVDYCCRDDYGAPADHVSAWAGLHYFAARNGRAANADSTTVITWPEGNGWFTRQWVRELDKTFELSALAYAVEASPNAVEIDYFDAKMQRSMHVRASGVIIATPQFITQHIRTATSTDVRQTLPAGDYSPWVVANLTLDARPQGRGMDLAWDNVIYDSSLLGYVVANHQTASRPQRETVITYYWPLSHASPSEARTEALTRSHYDWQILITADLYRAHPELVGHIKQLDVMVWGHGMIRPRPNYIWGDMRTRLQSSTAPVFYAHSDLSGISIFEEAFHRGRDAANRCREYLTKRKSAVV